jgi:hypothetical protein
LPGRSLSAFAQGQEVLCRARKNIFKRGQELRSDACPEKTSVKIRLIGTPLAPLFFKKSLKFLPANLKERSKNSALLRENPGAMRVGRAGKKSPEERL